MHFFVLVGWWRSGGGFESDVRAGNKWRGFCRRTCEGKAESVGVLGGLGGVGAPAMSFAVFRAAARGARFYCR